MGLEGPVGPTFPGLGEQEMPNSPYITRKCGLGVVHLHRGVVKDPPKVKGFGYGLTLVMDGGGSSQMACSKETGRE